MRVKQVNVIEGDRAGVGQVAGVFISRAVSAFGHPPCQVGHANHVGQRGGGIQQVDVRGFIRKLHVLDAVGFHMGVDQRGGLPQRRFTLVREDDVVAAVRNRVIRTVARHDHRVGAAAAGQGVVAATAVQQVVACAAGQGVVARAAGERVIAGGHADHLHPDGHAGQVHRTGGPCVAGTGQVDDAHIIEVGIAANGDAVGHDTAAVGGGDELVDAFGARQAVGAVDGDGTGNERLVGAAAGVVDEVDDGIAGVVDELGAACKHIGVVASAALERVDTGTASKDVGTAAPGDAVGAAAAGQGVGAGGHAGHGHADGEAVQVDRRRCARVAGARQVDDAHVVEQFIAADGDAVRHRGCTVGSRHELVNAFCACQAVVAVDGDGAGDHGLVGRARRIRNIIHDGVARVVDELGAAGVDVGVVARAAAQGVHPATASEGIVAGTAGHRVVGVEVGGRDVHNTRNGERATIDVHRVIDGRTCGVDDLDIAFGAVHVGIGGARHHVTQGDGGVCRVGVHRDHIDVFDALEGAEVVVARSIQTDGVELRCRDQRVVGFAITVNGFGRNILIGRGIHKRIVTCATQQHVSTAATGDDVVAVTPENGVGTDRTGQGVITIETVHHANLAAGDSHRAIGIVGAQIDAHLAVGACRNHGDRHLILVIRHDEVDGFPALRGYCTHAKGGVLTVVHIVDDQFIACRDTRFQEQLFVPAIGVIGKDREAGCRCPHEANNGNAARHLKARSRRCAGVAGRIRHHRGNFVILPFHQHLQGGLADGDDRLIAHHKRAVGDVVEGEVNDAPILDTRGSHGNRTGIIILGAIEQRAPVRADRHNGRRRHIDRISLGRIHRGAVARGVGGGDAGHD